MEHQPSVVEFLVHSQLTSSARYLVGDAGILTSESNYSEGRMVPNQKGVIQSDFYKNVIQNENKEILN